MPKLIPLVAIVVHRDGKAVRLNPNDWKDRNKEPFSFTDEEVADIMKADPDALRKPINEGGTDAAVTKAPTKSTSKPAAGNPEDM